MYLKVKSSRETSTGSLPRWLHQSEAPSRSPMLELDPSTWAVSRCFSQALSRSWLGSGTARTQTELIWDASVAMIGFASCISASAPLEPVLKAYTHSQRRIPLNLPEISPTWYCAGFNLSVLTSLNGCGVFVRNQLALDRRLHCWSLTTSVCPVDFTLCWYYTVNGYWNWAATRFLNVCCFKITSPVQKPL